VTRTSIAAAALATLGLLGLAGCGGSEESASTGTPLKTFQVVETEFKLMPATFAIDKAGTYAFEAVNRGQAVHSLEVEGNGVEVALDNELQPGDSGTLTADLDAGVYELYCPVGGHKDQGMKGSIGVERAPGSAEPEDTSGDSGYGYGN
jgi:uncharacterized cupredoxin-like copper-binding protein